MLHRHPMMCFARLVTMHDIAIILRSCLPVIRLLMTSYRRPLMYVKLRYLMLLCRMIRRGHLFVQLHLRPIVQNRRSMMRSRPLTIPRRHLLITGSALTVQVLWVPDRPCAIERPGYSIASNNRTKRKSKRRNANNKAKDLRKSSYCARGRRDFDKVSFWNDRRNNAVQNTVPHDSLQNPHDSITQTPMHNDFDSTETKQTTVPEYGSRRVPDDCQNRARHCMDAYCNSKILDSSSIYGSILYATILAVVWTNIKFGPCTECCIMKTS